MTSILRYESVLNIIKIIRCNISSHTVSITKPHKTTYARTYPTLVVRPDGSTYYIRYPEPRMIIQLPLDLSTLSEDEKRARLEKRKPKRKVTIVESTSVSYDPTKYIKKIKKK